ncbi:hypothetical protein B0H14DRAFT_2796938 [Mycena olivaceomarginata]|nr:hypothetical protein B0H14DRAFT_2796938 [Mycena olivaceomarginata]
MIFQRLLGLCLEHIPGWSLILALAVFLLIGGPRLPVLPVTWVLILGIGLIQTGSLICELAQNVCILIAGRVVSGVGGVGIILAIFEVFTRVTLFFKETRHQGLPLSLEIYRRPVAAHSALPVEMLQRIFLFCGSVSDINEMAESGTQPILLALCGVCSHWRAVALDTAELWSDIKVTFSHKTLERLLAPLKVWLFRARHHPLTLKLDVVFPVPGEQDVGEPEWRDFLARFDEFVVECSYRAQTLDIDVTLFEGRRVVVVAPKLRSLTIRANIDPIHVGLSGFKFPWSNLTTLKILVMIDQFSEYYFVLRQCTSLTTASFALNAYDFRAVQAANQDLSLPCLTNLTIDAQNISIVSCFLEKIALNSLTDLEIELHDNLGDSAARFHSFPSLLRLEIHGEYCQDGSISAGDFDRLLGACPNIVEARVDGEAKLQRGEATSHLVHTG